MRYDRFDTTGVVATAGSYAFLMPDGQSTSVVTTYEQLRTESTVMRVHVDDAHGASWASFYDAVAVGDVVEWREAEDCWIAYRVTEVLPDPPGVQPRKGFAVQWLAYAGTGCSGVIPARAAAHIDWAPRPPIQSSEVIAPVRFGAYVFGPENWRGELDPTVTYGRPAEFESDPPPIVTSDIEEARELPLWRDAALPEGWTLLRAESGTPDSPPYGFSAYYVNEQGLMAVEISVGHRVREGGYLIALKGREQINEARIIDGNPAIVVYTPPANGPHGTGLPTEVRISDQVNRIAYTVKGIDQSIAGNNIDAAIAIARSLYDAGETGEEASRRLVTSPAVDALFDQIMSSIRIVEVGATPVPTPAVCTHPTAADCIRAVYLGAPGDYAQVADIPAEVLLTPGSDDRYHVERGQQYTVVTAAPLPAGWTRFWLERTPLGTPSPVSSEQLIPPVGTTYTFTVTEDEAASTLITFDLKQARPFIRPRPDNKPHIGATVVTTKFLVPALRYNILDTTGAAATAGSYTFLTTAGDATSATQEFSRVSRRAVELRIHPADASGTSRATFYDTVKIGDTLDYRTLGLDCGFRFKVTSVTSTATPRSFGIERVRAYGHWCGSLEGDPGTAHDVEFVWKVRTGLPGPGGVRVLLRDEPTGQGTYRIAEGLPWVIDVPPGIEITFVAIYLLERDPSNPNQPHSGALFRDAATGSALHIDPETGRDFYRVTTSSEVDALFDQIAASIRRVE